MAESIASGALTITMIDAEQIAAFEEENDEAIAAANEFKRRAEKGLPTDRWGSVCDMQKVAKGIHAYQMILAMQCQVIEALSAEMLRKGSEAMRLHKAHQG